MLEPNSKRLYKNFIETSSPKTFPLGHKHTKLKQGIIKNLKVLAFLKKEFESYWVWGACSATNVSPPDNVTDITHKHHPTNTRRPRSPTNITLSCNITYKHYSTYKFHPVIFENIASIVRSSQISGWTCAKSLLQASPPLGGWRHLAIKAQLNQ